jgi:hypothetical protein
MAAGAIPNLADAVVFSAKVEPSSARPIKAKRFMRFPPIA